MKICAACKSVRYCVSSTFTNALGRIDLISIKSKECQKASWSYHKLQCATTQRIARELRSEGHGELFGDLRLWIRKQRLHLKAALLGLLDLPQSPAAFDDTALLIELDYSPVVRTITARFEVTGCLPLDWQSYKNIMGEDFLRQVADMTELQEHGDSHSSERIELRGTAFVVVAVPGAALARVVPFLLTDVDALEAPDSDWEEKLRLRLSCRA